VQSLSLASAIFSFRKNCLSGLDLKFGILFDIRILDFNYLGFV